MGVNKYKVTCAPYGIWSIKNAFMKFIYNVKKYTVVSLALLLKRDMFNCRTKHGVLKKKQSARECGCVRPKVSRDGHVTQRTV